MMPQIILVNKMLAIFFVWGLCLFIFLINVDSANAEKLKVYWGGVGFTGSWSERDQLYPLSSRLLCNPANKCKGNEHTEWGGNIDVTARERLASRIFDNITIELNTIEDDIEGTIMAVGITSEMLGITKTVVNKKTKYQHVFRIFGSLMFYEFSSGKVIKNIPIIIKYTTFKESPVTDNEKFTIIKNILSNDGLGINFFDVMYQKTKSVDLQILPSQYTQITEITLSDVVSKTMSGSIKQNNFKVFIAQVLEAQLISRSDAPLLPSSLGGDGVKQKLKATFADAERELNLSEAAFEIALDVLKFKKFEKKSGAGKTVCHAVAVMLRVKDQYEMFLNSNIRFTRVQDSCGIAAKGQTFDPTFYFPESLFSLTQAIASQFSKSGPDKEWLSVNSKKTPDAIDQINEVRKVAFESAW